MTQTTDEDKDILALRTILTALRAFDRPDQERLVRWTCEKLGIIASKTPGNLKADQLPASGASAQGDEAHVISDIRTFIAQKQPKSGVQFAAAVAYYHQFEAPKTLRKQEIGSEDLQEACRTAGRSRLADPGQTLRDSLKMGVLDKGTAAGLFKLNTVGENLVAMTLPTDKTKIHKKR